MAPRQGSALAPALELAKARSFLMPVVRALGPAKVRFLQTPAQMPAQWPTRAQTPVPTRELAVASTITLIMWPAPGHQARTLALVRYRLPAIQRVNYPARPGLSRLLD